MVGYCAEKDGYRIYVPQKHGVILSRDVTFKDEEVTALDNTDEAMLDSDKSDDEDAVDIQLSELLTSPVLDAVYNDRVLRKRKQIKAPPRFEDCAMLATDTETTTYTEAAQPSKSQQWQRALDEEMRSLMDNNMWTLIDKPRGRLIVNNKWVYEAKLKTDGTVDKYKAKLVAKGYTQKQGIDYSETFSPVARFDTISMVMSVAASEGLKLSQFDVKRAFLYGEVEDDIYMHQIEGYDDGSGKMCKLKKSLYGLKQASRCWNKKFTPFLEKHGIQPSDANSCLFIGTLNDSKLMLMVYVDNGLVACENNSFLNRFMIELAADFQNTTSDASCFLGIQIQRLSDGSVAINQGNYVKQLRQRFNMADCNPVTTSIDKGHEPGEGENAGDEVSYREIIGSLMYLVIGTRPDIAYAVSVLSRVLDRPTNNDWSTAKRILRYLKGMADIGIVYHINGSSGSLVTFSNADYARDPASRRSTTGVICVHGGAVVSWLSQLQKSVSLFTMDAEIIAASETTKEVV